MPTLTLSLNWTDQGIRGIKNAPNRCQLWQTPPCKKGGRLKIKHLYLTAGESDLISSSMRRTATILPNSR